jgi:hypothetical protein
MGEHRRKADGRRVFGTEFKRETVQRILTGEKTVMETSSPVFNDGRCPAAIASETAR